VASVFQTSESGSAKFAHDQAALDANILSQQHMAHLGKELFSKHLVSVEIAGTLLLVALVGTVAIVSHSQQAGRRRQGDS
jgi:NADH:ubiquinone oxidoreductase subunit 6 (subunit J)